MSRPVTRWLFVCAIASVSIGELNSAAQTGASGTDRAAIIAALEKLVATGEPRHTSHDDGEWLQGAVLAAINNGDQEIERLAVRAAAPIVARIRRPVASIQEAPSLEVDSSVVLKLPRPISYRADVHVSVDGSDYALLWTLQSGQRAHGKVHEGLPRHAFQPGYHSVRLKAHVTFGAADRGASWTETRDLPDLAYALYDPDASGKSDPSAFLTAPRRVSAQQFDPTLPSLPLTEWLNGALPALDRPDGKHEWLAMYCDERTAEPDLVPRAGDICSVLYFQTASGVGQIWVRTGQLRFGPSGPEWTQDTPRFEAITIDNGTTVNALSDLVSLLKSDPASWPRAQISVSPEDIVVTQSPGPGARGTATVSVRNTGKSVLHGVFVDLAAATTPTDRAPITRHFVVTIPAEGTASLKLDVAFPAGYGAVLAFVMYPSEHAPFSIWSNELVTTPQAAFRVVNGELAPPRLRERRPREVRLSGVVAGVGDRGSGIGDRDLFNQQP